jgi:hypothetical protein
MVVENPVTSVLYNQLPFAVPYSTLNVLVPEYGPQLTKILVELTRLDSIMLGGTTCSLISAQYAEEGAPAELIVEVEAGAAVQFGAVILL